MRTDHLLDAYTNRDFSKVYAALMRVRERLAPMLAAAPDAFSAPRKNGGANISRGKIDVIRRLGREGLSVADLARTAQASRPTVYRHLPDAS